MGLLELVPGKDRKHGFPCRLPSTYQADSATIDLVAIVTFFGIHGTGVHMTWRNNRELLITYPAKPDIEYAVSKIRGVKFTSNHKPLKVQTEPLPDFTMACL